jgi:HK97 gp10 family phage protein
VASRIVLHEQALNELLHGPDGGVAKDILRRTIQVERAAKQLCPVDTGRLRSSVTHELDQDAQGVVGIIGTDVDYAPFVEFGTSRASAQPFLRPALGAAQ